jgi:hypothetical protein
MNYNRYAKKIYEWNKEVGWWDDPNRCLYQTLQLVSTEIAEATEGERKDLYDDHIPHRKMGEVELADALIRVLDFGQHMKVLYKTGFPSHVWCFEDNTIGQQHLGINAEVIELAQVYSRYPHSDMTRNYSMLIESIAKVSENQGYDLEGAVKDKMLYNTTRIDHTREYRGSHFDGKKF